MHLDLLINRAKDQSQSSIPQISKIIEFISKKISIIVIKLLIGVVSLPVCRFWKADCDVM